MAEPIFLSASDQSFVITRAWAGLLSLAILLGLIFLGHLLTSQRGRANTRNGNGSQETSTEQVAFRRQGIKALVIGSDGRASTSKVQPILWTFAVFYALVFMLLWGRSIGCTEYSSPECQAAAEARQAFFRTVNSPLQPEYYVLLGFPLAAAVAARAMTSAKDADKTLVKPSIAKDQEGFIQGLAEVVSNDDGETDLMDFQYFAFNLLALAFFLMEFLAHPALGLPELPPTLIALSGLSTATYTTKKALETGSPRQAAKRNERQAAKGKSD